jgi:hypothetical protein
MNYQVKITFIGNVEGEYQKVTQIYLVPAQSFGDAEKAVIIMVKENEDPKPDSIEVLAISLYKIAKVIYKDKEVFEDDMLFFEAVLQITDISDNGTIKKVKSKMLVQEEDINKARITVLKDHGLTDAIFNDEKLISLKEVNVYKSLI